MLYYVKYSCGCGDNEEIILAETQEIADEYAYQRAIEEYDSFEGLHGIRSLSDIIEEDFNGEELTDEEYQEAEEIYQEEKESTINYYAEEYNEEKHEWILEAQNGVVIEV